MADTGLLVSHAFDENGIVNEQIYKKLLLDKLEVNMGMIMENVAAQMLAAGGHQLYFYANSSRDDVKSRIKAKYAQQTHIAYVLHTGDLKENDGIVYLPLYMAALL